MAVRRLGQSVTDLLRQRSIAPPVIRLCNAQQRGFADSPEQKDVNGIPVEVCRHTLLCVCTGGSATMRTVTSSRFESIFTVNTPLLRQACQGWV